MTSAIGSVAGCWLSALLAAPSPESVSIPTIEIGLPGNSADPVTAFGRVDYSYRIGRYETTTSQYAAFLNSVATSDPYQLYNPSMASEHCGIARLGESGSYSYQVAAGRENNPVVYVNFWDACRFANWMHNGQLRGTAGTDSTEHGAYELGGITEPDELGIERSRGAIWAIASENEWYKAAYHQPAAYGGDADGWWRFGTSSNVLLSADANVLNRYGHVLPVGSFAANFFGGFDFTGNVIEWTDTLVDGPGGLYRPTRGGSFSTSQVQYLQSDTRVAFFPSFEGPGQGFRMVLIPGPASMVAMGLGALVRRRRQG